MSARRMNSWVRPLAATIPAVSALVLLAACGPSTANSADGASGSSASPSSAGKSLKIISVNDSAITNPFQATANVGLQAAGAAFNAKVTFLGPATANTFSAAQDVQLLNSAIAQHPAGLIVDDATPGLDPVIKSAVAAGIPVVLYVDGLGHATADGAITYVGSDDRLVGEVGGQEMAASGAKHALCVTIPLGEAPQIDERCEGFTSTFAKDGRTVSDVIISTSADQQEEENEIAASIQKYKDADGIYIVGSPFLPAMQAAIQSTGRHMITGTVDSTQPILQDISDKTLTFAESIQGYLQGYYAVQYLAQEIRLGEHPITTSIIVGPRVIDSSNVAQALSVCNSSKVC
jgi:simple sugar transport system substrate-binding protein